MKPILTVLAMACLISVSNISCTKTGIVPKNINKNPIAGLWVGTWKVPETSADSTYYSFVIDSNGMMTTTSIAWAGNSDAAVGPWQLSGTNFTASVTQLTGGSGVYVQALTAVYDSVAGTLTGTSTFTQGPGSNQTFLLNRVQ